MCEFCIQHGEGKKWYLQARNYSREMLNLKRLKYMYDFGQHAESWGVDWASGLDQVIATNPATKDLHIAKMTRYFKQYHYGQVVPIEEINQILDMTTTIIRVPCVCRSSLQGKYNARFCFLITTSVPQAILANVVNVYPDFSNDFEVLTQDRAKMFIHEHDRDALVHTIWTFITPFIGAICNCNNKDCVPLRWRYENGLNMFFKAEYVANVNMETCFGCKDCMKSCNFDAIEYSTAMEKCIVNQHHCYGCGVCRAVCPVGAISLHDRKAAPLVANEW